jgi:hypothetical protein
MLAFARMMAPAAFSRTIAVASCAGTKPLSASEPAAVSQPSVSILSPRLPDHVAEPQKHNHAQNR